MAKQTLTAASAVIENKKIISPASIDIENGIIQKISETIPGHAIKDLKAMTLLPGFTNAHAHLELTEIGPLQNKSFVPWIREMVEHKILQTEKSLAASVKSGIRLNKDSGVTTIIDLVSFNTAPKTHDNPGVNLICFGEVLGVAHDLANLTYHTLKENKDKYTVPFHLTPHAIHTVSPDILRRLFAEESRSFSIHLNESRTEDDYFKLRAGEMFEFIAERVPEIRNHALHDAPSALQYIMKKGWSLNNSLITHANYLDTTDLNILKTWQNNCICHCPGSHEFFGHQKFLYTDLKEKNIKIALGTDGIVSNSCLNYLHEIQIFLKNYPATGLFELFPMITTNALTTIGIEDRGMIKEGCHADLIGFENPENKDVADLLKQKNKVDWTILQDQPWGCPE